MGCLLFFANNYHIIYKYFNLARYNNNESEENFMKFMARILAIVLMIAMMVSVVGCNAINNNEDIDNNSQNEETSKNDVDNGGFFDKLFGKEEVVDVEYEPSVEGLVGIAVYEIPKGEEYPFKLDEKVLRSEQKYYGFNKWESIYFNFFEDIGGYTIQSGKNVEKVEKLENNQIFISASYIAKGDNLYWGYVYQVNGELYIIPTTDLVNFDDNNSANKTMNICGSEVSFTITRDK
jgi:hypothetical protein